MMKTVSTLLVTLGILTGSGIASAYEGNRAPTVAVHDYRANDNRDFRPLDQRRPPPPPLRMERVRPRSGFVWISGNYQFSRGRYVWVGGHWERRNRGSIVGRWEHGRYDVVGGRSQIPATFRR